MIILAVHWHSLGDPRIKTHNSGNTVLAITMFTNIAKDPLGGR